MANPFLVLGGIAVGVVTAAFGVLQVSGWVDSAHDASAINDLANLREAQSLYMSTKGVFSSDFDVLTGDRVVADGPSFLGGGGGRAGGVVSASVPMNVPGVGDDLLTRIDLSPGVSLSLLETNGTGDAYCAVLKSASGKYFAASEDALMNRGSSDIYEALDGAHCQQETRGEYQVIVEPEPEPEVPAEKFSVLAYTIRCDADGTVTLPMASPEGEVKWSDGRTDTADGAPVTRAVPAGQELKVTFTGEHDGFRQVLFAQRAERECFRSMDEWTSSTDVVNGDYAFQQMANLTDVPAVIPTLTSAQYMFEKAATFNDGDVTDWDMSQVTSTMSMFDGNTVFNQPIGDWTTSSVTGMTGMFVNAKAFNQPLGKWDMSKVENTVNMFRGAAAFDQPIGGWDMQAVTSTASMFNGATSFNQPIGDWTFLALKDISSMFADAASFDQPVGEWNTATVTNMASVFTRATSFNQPLAGWKTGDVTSMRSMFSGASSFNQPIGSWDTSKVTLMDYTFQNATAFNQDINAWNVENVTTIRSIFQGAQSFNKPLSKWKPAKATLMLYAFSDAKAFNQPLSTWETRHVKDVSQMFYGASSFSQDLSGWDTFNMKVGSASNFATGSLIEKAPAMLPNFTR